MLLIVALVPAISVAADELTPATLERAQVGDTVTMGDFVFAVNAVVETGTPRDPQTTLTFDLIDYNGNDAEVTVPAIVMMLIGSGSRVQTVEVGLVTGIGVEAFKDNTTLTSVDLSTRLEADSTRPGRVPTARTDNLITTIGTGAFEGCTALSTVTFGANLTTIGNRAFYGCVSLTEITFPESVRTLGVNSFNTCSALKTVYLNEGLEKIGMGSFTNTGVQEIVIPGTVTMIGMGTDGTSYGGKTFGAIKTMFVHAMNAQSGSGIMETSSNPTVYTYEGSNVSSWGLPEGVTISTVKNISSATLDENFAVEYLYDGKSHSPVDAIVHSGTALSLDTHFTISYERNGRATADLTNAGTIVAIVEGIHTAGYMGTAKFDIKIKPIDGLTIIARDKSVEDGSFVTGTATDVIYWGLVDGDVIESVKLTANGDALVPSNVVVKNGELNVSNSYIITYANGRSFTEKSIESFTKTTEGNVDTYTIVFGDGTVETIVITNGVDGAKGEKGDTGEAGAQGPQGEKGEKGDTGEAGAQGPQGEKGDKGDTGEAGAQGPQGEKGDKGDIGEAGAQGPQGEKGEKGDTGATGAQGPQGEKGDTGAQGEKGDTGSQGVAGADGSDGADGKDGEGGSDNGCGSSISLGAISIVAVVALAGVAFRKKDDR